MNVSIMKTYQKSWAEPKVDLLQLLVGKQQLNSVNK